MSAEVKTIEIKKPQNVAVDQVLSLKKVESFISDVKSEIQKITWTNRDELIFYTKLVVGSTFVCGMAIYLLDLVIQGSLSTLNFLLHLIGG
ncbi:MAG: preprotein translocase subunit SecE [Parachlamydiaceae bacterium]